jgi:hypothetical protein
MEDFNVNVISANEREFVVGIKDTHTHTHNASFFDSIYSLGK